MSKSIRISEKHGVNPCISKCMFCGGDKGIVLLGKLKNDAEAPREMVFDYEPCDNCKEVMKNGVSLIGTTTYVSDNRPPITVIEGVEYFPTGSIVVLAEDSAICVDKGWKKGQKVLTEDEVVQALATQE